MPRQPDRIVVMGVSGSGKSTLGVQLAALRGATFLEGDSFHSAANVAKMAAGTPLTDADRWPWLAALRQALRAEDSAVVACSALKRSYRDALRAAGDVRFLYLHIGHDEAMRRLKARMGHYMKAGMIDSQLAALEPPAPDETDVVAVDEDAGGDLVQKAEAGLAGIHAGTSTAPLLALGGERHVISEAELEELVRDLAAREIVAAGARRVLLVPPDHTRLHSRAGEITGHLYRHLAAEGCEVAVLPALGTHTAMTEAETDLLFRGLVPFDAVLRHRWRDGLTRLGEIGADEVEALSGGRMNQAIPVEVDEALLGEWDLVVSAGQVVPHEVIGMANFTKNLVIGLGGAETINRSHFLSAVCGIESVMGRAQGPVRDAVDAAFDRFLAQRVNVLWLLTVTEDTADGVVHRGLFAGRGGSGETGGAAFRAAAGLALRSDVQLLRRPEARVVCRLDPDEFRTTWLGNKAVYRTRMAMADDGELVVLAPGVSRFGEDPTIDALIRRHGYHGTAAALEAVRTDPELAANLGAAAHLIHGSSEGRFRITYCTDPETGGLTREEVEAVGYGWHDLNEEVERLGLGGEGASGTRHDADGAPFTYIANPALGLWATAERFRA